jgi:hypothetical protein
MKKLIEIVGALLFGASFLVGAVVYLVPAGIFFSRGDLLLGFLQLFLPPAALVLPWIIDPLYGIAGVVSVVTYMVGAAMMATDSGK